MKKTAGSNIFHTLGGDKDEYWIYDSPLKVIYHYEEGRVIVDSAIDTITGKEMVAQNSDVDFRNLIVLISEADADNAGHEKDQENAFGNMEESGFEPREYHRVIEKKALRNKRLDELDEEEGLLGTDRFHSDSERRELPEVDFEPEADEEVFPMQDKKDKRQDRLNMIRERHQSLKKKPQSISIEPEQTFEETIPDKTNAEEVAELFEEKPEAIALMSGEEDEVIANKPGVNSDAAFDSSLFLPLEDLKILAPSFAEDYGYSGNESYIMPASAQSRSELKALLIRIYDNLKIRTGGKFDKNDEIKNEIKNVDGLNDLEIRHALNYYKKIDILEKRKHSNLL